MMAIINIGFNFRLDWEKSWNLQRRFEYSDFEWMKMSITEITNDDFDDESEERWNLHILRTKLKRSHHEKDDNQLQDRRYFCTLVLLIIKESFDLTSRLIYFPYNMVIWYGPYV